MIITQFPSALTIAGSDPSGGAGIQMDLKTFARTDVWGMAAITALTAQNASRVSGSWAVDPVVVSDQITTILEDMTPGAIKTGMLANSDIIKIIEQVVPDNIPLIVDPVMISTSGYHLLQENAISDMREMLLPRSHIITPNIPEAEILTGFSILSEEEMIEAGKSIIDLGAKQAMIKGGHGTGSESVDILVQRDKVFRFTHRRMPYDVHGSGCSFSAAITGFIAKGMDDAKACEEAKKLTSRGIDAAISGSSGKKMINP